MRRSIIAVILFLGLSLAFIPGCGTSQPEFENVAGTIEGVIPANPEKVTLAAKKVVEELKFNDITYTSTKIDGYVTARTAQDAEIDIKVDLSGDDSSEIAVKVGNFGDEAVSLKILSMIKSKL